MEKCPRPLYLKGYGAYGGMIETKFDILWIVLVNMGFITGFAHVRGDGDLGTEWYIDGKYDRKNNTILDFVTCLRYLINMGYTTPELTAIYGRSAGGLLVGGALNIASELVKVGINQVPFVDVIGDMIDTAMPWVAFEW